MKQFLLSKHGRSWDDAPVLGVGIRELDRRTLDEFRHRGVASHRLPSATLNESHGNLIELLHLREGEYLRRAAVLLFHPDPTRFFRGAFVKIGYFRTETDLAYQDVIEGSLFAQADRAVDLLLTKYSKHWISYHGILRRETPLAPGDALREAVLNAIAHRDYGNPAPIQIRVYDNRISLWNPGALPTGWTLDKLMGAHASAPRNPGIANAFFRAGMIEAWGRGVADILKSCRLAGTAQPRWEVDPDGLWLEFAGTRADDGSPALQAADKTDLDGSDISNEEIRGGHLRPESGAQPELRPGSLAERVLRQLAQGPLSKAGLSSKLGQKRVSGQLNKEIRVLVRDGRIGYTLPEKPRSRLQMYRLTDKGRATVQRFLLGRAEEEIRGGRPRPESGVQPESQPETRLEWQPELRPGSLAERVLRQLARGPLSKAGLSSKLGQKRVSGQLNKEIRVLVRDGRIGYTLPGKPRSRLQAYRLTDKGRAAVQRFLPGRAEEEIRGHRPRPESGAQPETQPESRPEMRLESQLE